MSKEPEETLQTEETEDALQTERYPYYMDLGVDKYITAGCKRKLSKELVNALFLLAYAHASDLDEKGLSADYLLVFNIESNDKHVKVKLSQEVPEYSRQYEFMVNETGGKEFTGKVYMIEDVGEDIHHITLLLPEEY